MDKLEEYIAKYAYTCTEFDINYVPTANLPAGMLDPLTDVRSLEIWHNKNLRTLPPKVFDKMVKLERLMVVSNPLLTALPARPFGELTRLMHLTLSYCPIKFLPDDTFVGLENLIKLKVCGLEVESFPPISFLTNLTHLNLSENKSIRLPTISGLSSLKRLILKGNNLEELPDLGGLTSLKFLDVSENNITAVPDDSFEGLRNLRELNLSFNPLAHVPDAVLNLRKLTTLLIENIDLVEIPFELSIMVSLRFLNINSDKFAEPFDKLNQPEPTNGLPRQLMKCSTLRSRLPALQKEYEERQHEGKRAKPSYFCSNQSN